MRKKLRLIYLLVIACLLVITAISLLHAGGDQIDSTVLAGIAFASIITSLVPFFMSMYFLKKSEKENSERYRVWGIILYVLCFPVKALVILATIYEILFGSNHWAFG
ncbi:hypothetical protein [Fluviicola sp.]|uniref:hypothetical protein n=1 Tax=Fluviicola sp. TaxID=1917219 RepID=UPI0031D24BCD